MNTRMAAFVFCDVVGSTALQIRLGDDAADPLRRLLFGALREAVAAQHGEEVKTLGDGMMAAFTSAAEAVDCAIGMQRGTCRVAAGADLEISLRVGVSAGEATREVHDWFGTPVIEAARLCAQAQSGQILLSPMAHSLAAPRRRHSFRALDTVRLKGLPDGMLIWEVVYEPLGDNPDPPLPPTVPGSEIPVPSPLRVAPPFGFLGRAEERLALTTAWQDVVAGEHRAVLMGGEPGIGKTTLAAEFARAVHADGGLVLYGRCQDDGIPYQPFVEALRGYASEAELPGLTMLVRSHGDALVRLVPELEPRFPGTPASRSADGETERYRLFHGVSAFLAELSRSTPILVLLDDLHWASKPTLLLFKHLAAATEQLRLLLMGTYRRTDISATHPLAELLAELRPQPAVKRLELKGLSGADVVALAERMTDQALDHAVIGLAHTIQRESEGNPFFIGEMLRHLIESGVFDQDSRPRQLSDIGLPSTVREVIGFRVRRLGADAAQVLSMAAVIGRDFDFEILASVTEVSEERLLDVLDTAVAAGLIEEAPGHPDRFSFSHALVRQALYEDFLGLRRARAHEKVALALEAACGDEPGGRVSELAHHWLAATRPVHVAKALEYSQRAGDWALDQLAPEEAVTWYTRALEIWEASGAGEDVRTELLIGLGQAQRQAGQEAFRGTLLDAARLARDREDRDRLVRAAMANNRGVLSSAGAVDEERVEILRAALEVLGDGDSRSKARVLATLAAELTGGLDWQRRRALADEALAMARRVGDDVTLARVLNLRNVTFHVPETVTERLEQSSESLRLTARLDDPFERFWALAFRLASVTEAGDLGDVDDLLAEMEAVARHTGQPALLWFAKVQRSWRTLLAGDIAAADELALEAFQIGTDSGQPDAMPVYAVQLWAVRLHQGRLGELTGLLRQAITDNPGLPALAALLAFSCVELGETEDAGNLLTAAAAAEFVYPHDPGWSIAIAAFAEVCAVIGDQSAAAVLDAKLRPFAGQLAFGVVVNFGAVDRYLGLLAAILGRFDEAEARFRSAAGLHRRLGTPIWLARTYLDWGDVLIRSGQRSDVERARPLLDEALGLARDFACAPLSDRAAGALESIGTVAGRREAGEAWR